MPRWLTISIAAVVIVVAGLAVVAPIGPLPGVWLGGRSVPPPDDWSALDLPQTVQLQTVGGLLPRVVNLWIVQHDADLYVLGNPASGWVQAATANPMVALRIGDSAYTLRAQRVQAAGAYAAYRRRYQADFPDLVASLPPPEAASTVAIFRLVRPST